METEIFSVIKVPSTIVHVVSVVFGMGAALLSDVLFTFYAKDRVLNPTERKTLEILSSAVWYSLVVIGISGLALFLSDMPKYLDSAKFLAKLTILAVLIVNGYVLSRKVWPHVARPGFLTRRGESSNRRLAFVGGAISVVSWLSVCTLGVLDSSPAGYPTLMALYACILIVAIPAALAVERREFEKKNR